MGHSQIKILSIGLCLGFILFCHLALANDAERFCQYLVTREQGALRSSKTLSQSAGTSLDQAVTELNRVYNVATDKLMAQAIQKHLTFAEFKKEQQNHDVVIPESAEYRYVKMYRTQFCGEPSGSMVFYGRQRDRSIPKSVVYSFDNLSFDPSTHHYAKQMPSGEKDIADNVPAGEVPAPEIAQ